MENIMKAIIKKAKIYGDIFQYLFFMKQLKHKWFNLFGQFMVMKYA